MDAYGEPRVLETTGEPSEFARLVQATNAELIVEDILRALVAANSVVVDAEGRVRAIQRYFVPRGADDPETIRRFGLRLRDLAATIDYNASCAKDRTRNFEATAYSARLTNQDLTLFRRLVADHGARFLEQMDSWLESHEDPDDQGTGTATTAGVGVYLFTETTDAEKAAGATPSEPSPPQSDAG